MADPVYGGPLVVLIGPMGAGKTRIGKRVARLLDVAFVDTDKRIAAEHGVIADIFAGHGETHFRSLERAAVQSALTETGVVSLGGGAVLDTATQRDLASHPVVLLTVSAEAVASRITGNSRPMLTGGLETWVSLAHERRPIYEKLARHTWDTSSRPAEKIAAEIAEWASSRARSEGI